MLSAGASRGQESASSPAMPRRARYGHHQEAQGATANRQAPRGFEWTNQHRASPTRSVTDPCVQVAGGEAPGALEKEPCGETLGPSPTLRHLSHCGAGMFCHNLEKPHVPMIKVFRHLCTMSLVLNCDTCLSRFVHPGEWFKVSITTLMSFSELPSVISRF